MRRVVGRRLFEVRAFREPDPVVLRCVAALLKPHGDLAVLVTDELSDADICGVAGLSPIERRDARTDDVEQLSSAWARRLGIPE
jgi:hypothetical protein